MNYIFPYLIINIILLLLSFIVYCKKDELFVKNYISAEAKSITSRSIYSEVLKKDIPVFWKPPKFRELNCNKFLIGDFRYIAKERKNRKSMNETLYEFSTSCKHIKRRGYYPEEPLTEEETKFPLAYAINVYQDYMKLEQQFLVMYAPQNHYCYAIDKKANHVFKEKLHSLAKCFPNIYIVKHEKELDHSGVNGNLYNYECMKLLRDKNYKYLFLLQNDDTPLKTNLELVKILQIYNGTIDMNIGDPIARQPITVDRKVSYKINSLKMFKKSDKRYYDTTLGNMQIKIQKGLMQASIPKATVDYMLKKINIVKLLENLNTKNEFSDEVLWPTIFTNPYLRVPGWQHYLCNKKTIFSRYYMTRKTIFRTKRKECQSGFIRNGICILGIESLSNMRSWPHFFGNKFRSSFDAGASMCWLEHMYNKKFFLSFTGINEDFYKRSTLIRYQKLKETEDNHRKICDMI